MISLTCTIDRFESNKDKTSWTFIIIPAAVAKQIHDNKKGFRVKGKLDNYKIEMVSLLPVGDGDFMMPLNQKMRKGIGKSAIGEKVHVEIELDSRVPELCEELLVCLEDEPRAKATFDGFTPSHQRYFSKWIEDAKTIETKTKRLTRVIDGLAKGWDYGLVLRDGKPPASER